MWRHDPVTRRLQELLPRIGGLQTVRSTFSFRLDREGGALLDPELGGGSLLDIGCYCVSAARLLAGREPDRVYGEAVVRGGVDVRFTGVLRFGEVAAEFTCGFTSNHRGLEAIGSDGSLSVGDPWHGSEGVVDLDGSEERVEVESAYRLELENLAAAVRGEAEPLLGRADALGQARTIDALLRSAASGAPVELALQPR